MKIYITS